MNSSEIQRMIQLLSRLPGLGPRSGRRVALHLLKKKDQLLTPLIATLKEAAEKIQICSTCYNLDTINPCNICQDNKRNRKLLCVVENVSDLWALERSQAFRGIYHVLGGTLSALDGVGPEQLTINQLTYRVEKEEIEEVLLALNATLDGQTTMYFLSQKLKHLVHTISTLAHGMPIGGELDYMDDGTIAIAYTSRQLLAS